MVIISVEATATGAVEMKLLAKFNLILLVVFGAGGVIIGELAHTFLINNARREVLAQGDLMMTSNGAVRDYTAEDLKPLLDQNPLHKVRFIAETIPFYAATTTFNIVRKSYPDFSYKEAALNPTNPEDRANDWEADVIQEFRDHPEQLRVVGERETPSGPALYIAHPIKVDAQCLECHSTPSAAPRAMLAVYGSAHGFDWKPNEIIGAQIISVPLSVPLAIANQAFRSLLIVLVLTLFAAMGALDAGVYWFVIRPLRIVSESGDRISRGDKNVPTLVVSGKDEIASVTASFNRMQVSLSKALAMLQEE
jgi:HAMP domain-containing protein